MECPKCYCPTTIKRGGYGKEGQRRKCKNCKKTFIVGERKRVIYSFDKKKHAVAMSKGYGNLARICRIYKISKNTVYARRKEVARYNRMVDIKMGYY